MRAVYFTCICAVLLAVCAVTPSTKNCTLSGASFQDIVYFGDAAGYVNAVNAITCEQVWRTTLADISNCTNDRLITSPTIWNDVLIIPSGGAPLDMLAIETTGEYTGCATTSQLSLSDGSPIVVHSIPPHRFYRQSSPVRVVDGHIHGIMESVEAYVQHYLPNATCCDTLSFTYSMELASSADNPPTQTPPNTAEDPWSVILLVGIGLSVAAVFILLVIMFSAPGALSSCCTGHTTHRRAVSI